MRVDSMCVLFVGTGAQIGDMETAAIRMYRGQGAPHQDDRIRNETDAATGYSPERTRVYLYLCYGSAEHERRSRSGVFMS